MLRKEENVEFGPVGALSLTSFARRVSGPLAVSKAEAAVIGVPDSCRVRLGPEPIFPLWGFLHQREAESASRPQV